MGAVIGVLNESLTESLRGFYKLRKAYVTLDSILAAEAKYMKSYDGVGTGTPGHSSVNSLNSNRSARSLKAGKSAAFGQDQQKPAPHGSSNNGINNGASHDDDDDDEGIEFHDAEEDVDLKETPAAYTGHLEENDAEVKLGALSLEKESRPNGQMLPTTVQTPIRHGLLDHDPDSAVFSNPIDVFIHSGANLCFGLLLIMISMIPPAFNRLLFVIGFHGDKDRGIRMLWQASKFQNINGAMAGLIVLGYYNTLIGFSDIIPEPKYSDATDDTTEGYPKERCEALLVEMRRRHPKSHLWLLEEARMKAANKELSSAIQLLEHSTKSPLKQVEALEMFEKALDAMYIHRYSLCSESFVNCVSLNNWSHALYYYIAGAAQVELYRQNKVSDPAAAAVYAKEAVKLLKVAPNHAGKKKFMARQLPFDVFVSRKIRKWEQRASDWGVSFIDAVGVSPLEEMIFFWNGHKRMDHSQLSDSMDRLNWSENEADNANANKEGVDEKSVLAVLRGATLRNLGKLDEARQVLNTVIKTDRNELKGGLKDDWSAPAAHYEMGVICWVERSRAEKEGKGIDVSQQWVNESESWIEKAARWDSYELDARIGIKIATAQDTLRKWKEKHGSAKTGTT